MGDEPAWIAQAAYGGEGWQPRGQALRDELGTLWNACGVATEWEPLKAVLLHEPGQELAAAAAAPNAAQMLAPLDLHRAATQHRAMADAYRAAGVTVSHLHPDSPARPNQMFMADLFFMTPEGAILARPASTVRAGEERVTAAWLAGAGIPILRTISGDGVFEGADAMWVDAETVLVGKGLRTNDAAVRQLVDVLAPMGVSVHAVDLPRGAMHLMGMLRIMDRDLAVAWPGRLSPAAVALLREKGFQMAFIPSEVEAQQGFALNGVTLGPRRFLMPGGNPQTQAFYENLGIDCTCVAVDELIKAAGAVGCLTGVVQRGGDC
ncbi:MAG: arginine deiminase family protein [Pseudomonadota bacterium]